MKMQKVFFFSAFYSLYIALSVSLFLLIYRPENECIPAPLVQNKPDLFLAQLISVLKWPDLLRFFVWPEKSLTILFFPCYSTQREIVRSRSIIAHTKGITALSVTFQRLPFDNIKFQLPLRPFISERGRPLASRHSLFNSAFGKVFWSRLHWLCENQ